MISEFEFEFFCVQASDCATIFKRCHQGQDMTVNEPQQDPTTTGFRYWFANEGGDIRKRWPLPDAARNLGKDDVSSDGCHKKRFVYVGHRQRSGLWIWLCMCHQRIIGYHIMSHGEGRRDPLLSLYRFKKTPPKVVFIDFSCGAEESALNWLPEYFANTAFYHDIFHGYGHVCSDRFSSSRINSLRHFNTSVMEQANNFLQTLRGLLISSTTKVSNILRLYVNTDLQVSFKSGLHSCVLD